MHYTCRCFGIQVVINYKTAINNQKLATDLQYILYINSLTT
jgi:hypothetical protein